MWNSSRCKTCYAKVCGGDSKRSLKNVTVVQTGCIGLCKYEPIVEVYEPNKEKVTYVKMTPEKVSRVVAEHIVNGKPVYEYTIGYEENKEANK